MLDAPDKAQLNLSRTVTLGTEESGRFRGVERRVSVWTVRQTKMAVVHVEKWPLVKVRLYVLKGYIEL